MAGLDPVLEAATAFGVIPVVEIEALEDGVPLAETLLAAGLGVIEVTFRTRAAADIIEQIATRCPAMLVGAGTIIDAGDLGRAAAAGARFALAPGFDPALVAQAASLEVPYLPGVMTPSELQLGIAHGVRTFKFFPALPAGGLAMLRAITAPFGLHEPRFVPTGGVGESSLAEWLGEPSVAAVGGSWIAPRAMIRDRDWGGIRVRAEAAVRAARAARPPA